MTGVRPQLDQLLADLPAWLPAQRWFAGKNEPVKAVRHRADTVLVAGDPLLVHLIVDVDQPGRQDTYQLLVGCASRPPEHLGTHWITAAAGMACYEATADGPLIGRLLDLIVADERIGPLRFAPEPEARLTGGLAGRPINAEQSNTSVVYGHQYILKLFRRPHHGPNQDLLMHRALSLAGCAHIARPLGTISGELDGAALTLGLMQEFLSDAVDGWALGTTSVRDLMVEPDRPGERDPTAARTGGDFAGEAGRLGETVAAVHADLRRALGTRQAGPAELAEAAARMHERLDTVLRAVPALGAAAPMLRAAFDRLASATGPPLTQAIHGDLHLGQALRTTAGWVLIDFEGEPAAAPHWRGGLRSPLRDVAGMLRSFDYAAHQLLVGRSADPIDAAEPARRALDWARRNRNAFCAGYAAASGADGIGDPRDHGPVLSALELDKAVYEVGYEHANRPEWLDVPLSSIARISAEGA